MLLDELTIDDQARYLAILFFWKQKKLSNELNGGWHAFAAGLR